MSFFIQGSLGFRFNELAKVGDRNEGGKHNFPHSSLVLKGRLLFITQREVPLTLSEREAAEAANPGIPAPTTRLEEESSKEIGAGSIVSIDANKFHIFEALEDDCVWYCLFSHRDFDGLVSTDYVGNVSAYA